MRSAFGVDHGEVSKAYTKMATKLVRQGPKATDDLAQRFRVNYSQWRNEAGTTSQGIKAFHNKPGAHFQKLTEDLKAGGRERKQKSQAMVTGIGNMNRKNRFLP